MMIRSACAVIALAAVAPLTAHAAEELNALVWCDHADPAFLEPFEKAHDVKVNVKEYQGTAEGLTMLEQSRPGDWDVMVIDAVDVHRAIDRDVLAPLPPEALPVADFFPELVMASHNSRDGVTYAVTDKFGYNTIAYNKSKVDPKDMESLKTLWSGKYDGRIGIYDYYLPALGIVALSQGVKTADLKGEAIEGLREPLMKLKAASKQVADVVGSQTALATGEVDILVGGGEFLTATLHAENPDLDYTIPAEGGVLWAESIAMLKDSQKPELALEFIKYVTSPEGQARLATSSCYWGMPANAKAGEHLTPEQKAVLRWDAQADYLKRAQLYPIPSADDDAAMQDLWTDMLQN
ncbi:MULTISPECIES: PotD/PotF family extracellular solute-binding protein [Paracoccus]|uniref:Extracellular solute-binding protein n=1 Tax=Paracoccus litorisediminis TaxID=2006130 RepID=A0A844HJM7_9RHOB|nr:MULTISPECIES: spermidine/putrescine ABC transporter substrate-binding protein [Paracoccus]MBD9528773.1 spermidine/putrescine ABC transporter substrate-binding protein [Paracoccus sp. PAR01]MTH60140.1 extracellular solute-binding protein [Paracoccus litorisediminis]